MGSCAWESKYAICGSESNSTQHRVTRSLELGTRRVRLDVAILQTDASFLSAL
jgi:hypothetical protein